MAASYADIIFFAVVAIYLGIKLFSVLGRKNEQDANIEARGPSYVAPEIAGIKPVLMTPLNPKQPAPVVKNILDNFKFASDEAKTGIKEVIEKDSEFSLETFTEGAKIAFEMILKAFSEGDKKTIKALLADELYQGFENQIDRLNAQKLISTKSLVGIDDMEILSASVAGSRVRISLKFTTEQINVTKDTNNNIVEGDPKKIEVVEDIWEFERNIRSGNPNWLVTAL